MRFTFYYKKLKIDWVLCDFYEPELSVVIDKILEETQFTKVISYGHFLCSSKEDLEKIYEILTIEYLKKENEKQYLPNLLEEKLKQFFIES